MSIVPDEFPTVHEVAERLRVNQQMIRNWIDRGELDAVRVGPRRIGIPSAELERFIAESPSGQLQDAARARSEFNLALKSSNARQPRIPGRALRRRPAKATNELARALPRG